jgi:signal transduction histidine kinase
MEETFAFCPILEGDPFGAICVFGERLTHDFNNLLLPMIAYPPVLRRQMPAAGEMLNTVEQAALAMQRINQGVMQLLPDVKGNAESFRLLDLAEDVVRALREDDIPPTVMVHLMSGGGPAAVSGGMRRMTRAIECLCRNGIEAMPRGGTLEITACTTAADKALPPAMIPEGVKEVAELRVRDTGEGIASNLLARIFDPFFTTKRGDAKRGAGLGLSIVYRTVREHSGWIALASAPKRGSTFRIIVPTCTVSG